MIVRAPALDHRSDPSAWHFLSVQIKLTRECEMHSCVPFVQSFLSTNTMQLNFIIPQFRCLFFLFLASSRCSYMHMLYFYERHTHATITKIAFQTVFTRSAHTVALVDCRRRCSRRSRCMVGRRIGANVTLYGGTWSQADKHASGVRGCGC